jgi:hypothetical protein
MTNTIANSVNRLCIRGTPHKRTSLSVSADLALEEHVELTNCRDVPRFHRNIPNLAHKHYVSIFQLYWLAVNPFRSAHHFLFHECAIAEIAAMPSHNPAIINSARTHIGISHLPPFTFFSLAPLRQTIEV